MHDLRDDQDRRRDEDERRTAARQRREALDRIIGREIRWRARRGKVLKTLGKLGIAVMTGAVPALIAGAAGWIGKVYDLIGSWLPFHGGGR
jgi:hypothetical protein